MHSPRSLRSAGVQVAAVLAADEPQLLAAFYGSLLEQPPQAGMGAGHWRVALPEGGWLEVYRPSASRPQLRQRGRLALCIRRQGELGDLQRWMERAQRLGAEVMEPPRQEPFGLEAWLLDPEGNALLLLVSPP